jgi:hypothetical protein
MTFDRSLAIFKSDLARGTVLHKTSGSNTLLLEHIVVLLAMDSYAILEEQTFLVMIPQEENIMKSTISQPGPLLTFFPASEMAHC